MSKQNQWLWDESRKWEQKGLVTGQQGDQIRALYPKPAGALPWSMMIFSGLGAVIAGMGIILMIAYNWQSLHKFAKLGLILGGIAGLHAGGIKLRHGSDRWKQLGEALCLLGTMLFGAGIWLVAQIYHIEEHFPNGFLIWGVGALALAWAMPSLMQGALAAVVLCIWGSSEAWGFHQTIPWAPFLVLAGTGLLAWRLRSPFLLFITLAAFCLSLGANVSVLEGGLVFRVLLNCAVVFVAISVLAGRGSWFPESVRIWAMFGWLGFLLCLYLLGFSEITEDLLARRTLAAQSGTWLARLFEWGPLVLTTCLWGVIGWVTKGRIESATAPEAPKFELWLLPMTAVLCQVLAFSTLAKGDWGVTAAFNLVFLALAVAWMVRGCREGLSQPMVMGSLLVVALVVARYFDLFESLALRGAIFLVVGALFFIEGILFRRARRRTQAEEVRS